MRQLIIQGASDDLIEFSGAYTEEFNIYSPTRFRIDIIGPERVEIFHLHAEFGFDRWELFVGTASDRTDRPRHIIIGPRPNGDPRIVIQLENNETVEVKQL